MNTVVIPNAVRNPRRPGRGASLPGERRFLAALGMTGSFALSLSAQGPPVRRIETASAVSTEQLGSITSVRELPAGRLLVNDGARRRLLVAACFHRPQNVERKTFRDRGGAPLGRARRSQCIGIHRRTAFTQPVRQLPDSAPDSLFNAPLARAESPGRIGKIVI